MGLLDGVAGGVLLPTKSQSNGFVAERLVANAGAAVLDTLRLNDDDIDIESDANDPCGDKSGTTAAAVAVDAVDESRLLA
jgi:hypothetical protein